MKIDLQQAPPQVGTLEEAQALINELWSLLRAFVSQNHELTQRLEKQGRLIEEQAKRIALLEEQLRTNSRNSSKPPSSDRPKDKGVKTRAKGQRKPGGQPGHAGKACELLAEEHVAHFHDCRPDSHCACGGRVAVNGLVGRHQVIDVPPITPVVTQYRCMAAGANAAANCMRRLCRRA